MSLPENNPQEPKVLPGYFSPAAPPLVSEQPAAPSAPAAAPAPYPRMPAPVQPYAAPQLQFNPTFGTQPIRGASFTQAFARFYSHYGVFNRRSSRSEYWWVAGGMTGVFALCYILSEITGGSWLMGLWALFMLGHLVPSIAVTVRRLHDVNLSGALSCLWLVPYVGFIAVWVLALLPEKPEGVRYDR